MAGDWIKFEHSTPDKPEVIRLAAELGIDHDAVVGKLLRLWIWADQQSVDGNGLGVTKAFLDRITSCQGFADALIKVGWLTAKDDSLSLPNFARHNGQTAKNRAISADRVKRFRNGPTVTKALPEKRREEKRETAPQPPEGAAGGASILADKLQLPRKYVSHVQSSADLLAHWAVVRADGAVRRPGAVIGHRLAAGEPAPPLTPETVRDAVLAGVVASISGRAVAPSDVTVNSKGVYVSGELAVAADSLSTVEYA